MVLPSCFCGFSNTMNASVMKSIKKKKQQPFFILLVTDCYWHVALKIFSHWRFFNEVKQTTSSLPFSILNKNLQYNVIQMHNWYGILRWIGYCKMSTYASNPYPSFIIVLKSVSIRDKPSSLPVLKNEIKSIYEIIYIYTFAQ